MLIPQLGDHCNRVQSAVLGQNERNYFHCFSKQFHYNWHDSLQRRRVFLELLSQFYLQRAAPAHNSVILK